MDKEIAGLYERRDKPKAAELYMDKAKNSWVDPNEIKPVEVPFYRAIFE
jgi:outer membrane protein assembly factor BamD